MLLVLVRLIYRVYVLGAALGLWAPPPDVVEGGSGMRGAAVAAPAVGGRCCGAALVQGRRFGQEDRAVALSGSLPALAHGACGGGGEGGRGGTGECSSSASVDLTYAGACSRPAQYRLVTALCKPPAPAAAARVRHKPSPTPPPA